jgi:hypothetical protein
MITRRLNKVLPSLSLILAFFTFVASYLGVFVASTYSRETASWTAQAIGQDVVNLFLVVPLLVILSVLIYKRHTLAVFVWAGAMLYLGYSYAIYCFALHFSELFLVYCLVFGLSFYAFLYFLYVLIDVPITTWFEERVPVKIVGAFLIIMAILFYVVWLSAIVPALVTNTTPQDITATGLLTNPVYVLDLSIFLPGFIVAAILAFKKNEIGLLLVPALISFIVLMTAAVAGINAGMNFYAVASDLTVAILMGVLSLVSIVVLAIYLKSLQESYRKFSV